MKQLFVLLRQGKADELSRILTERPDLLNCVSGPLPKKDHGQSLLQVALKTGNLNIADLLIGMGADVGFMETVDDDPGLRAPVLFDAISAVIDPLCINSFASEEEIRNRYGRSDKALVLLKQILAGGADVNKRSSNGLSALNWSLRRAEQIMKNAGIYPFSQEKVREQLGRVLDLLIAHGADLDTWLREGTYPEPYPGQCVQKLYFDKEDPDSGINYGTAREMRAFLQAHFRESGRIGC
jgi:ankyrin repeat protein